MVIALIHRNEVGDEEDAARVCGDRLFRALPHPLGMWVCLKPFTMYAIAGCFLARLAAFAPHRPAAVDHVTMPLGVNLDTGQAYGVGTAVLREGVKMLEVPLT
jgi:hypothetical protein